MTKVNRMHVMSFAKFQAICASLLGVVVGLLYSIGGLLIDIMVSAGVLSSSDYGTSGLSYGTLLAFGALVGMPAIFALSGFILGLFEAFLYNIYVKRFKAINLTFWQ